MISGSLEGLFAYMEIVIGLEKNI